MPIQYAARTKDLINSMGVATHINYTDGQYRSIDFDISALKYLGLSNVRDAAPNPASDPLGQSHLVDAANAGIKFTFFAQGDVDPSIVVARLAGFARAHVGSIVSIEGPNEVNNWPVSYGGLTGTAGAQAYQAAFYAAVKADPVLKSIPVIGFTDFPNHASASDWNNIHPYPKNGDQPENTISAEVQSVIDASKPFAITESGYHTSLTADRNGGWEGVDELTQAKMSLNIYMDAARQGSKSTYLYQLLDAYPDSKNGGDQETHFGLFRLDGSAKPAADAIHNLTSILNDSGANPTGFERGALNYSVSGLPGTGHSFLTEKSDKSFQIIVWDEPDIWDQANNRPISAKTNAVTVDLGNVFGTVEVFDPLQRATALQTLHNVSSISVGVSDHPLVIQVSGMVDGQTTPVTPVDPSPAPTPVTPTPTTPTTTPTTSTPGTTIIGSGADQLVFKVSEDAYNGDAQFTIAVDGKQVGGTLTAHASHAAGQSDTVTVNGDWAPGDHNVTVTFLNDAYGGTATTDRNLYVESVTYNGAAVADSHFSLLSSGAHGVTVHDTGPVTTPVTPVDPSPAPTPVTPTPTTSTTTPTTSTPGATIIGSGADQLVFKVSEDAYNGDAQFTIAVDGKQVGGTLTAHASHAAGQSDTVTVNGDWAPGDHNVTVTFLNDAYGGTATTDRNLYVESVTYNGAAVADSHFSLLSAGPHAITVHDYGLT